MQKCVLTAVQCDDERVIGRVERHGISSLGNRSGLVLIGFDAATIPARRLCGPYCVIMSGFGLRFRSRFEIVNGDRLYQLAELLRYAKQFVVFRKWLCEIGNDPVQSETCTGNLTGNRSDRVRIAAAGNQIAEH